MKIKKIQNPYNHRIFDLLLIDENKILSIAYLDNLDIYWTFFSEDSNEIEIKDDYDPLYKLFKKLYDDMINFSKQEEANYGMKPIDGEKIKWYSDDVPINEADSVEMSDEKKLIRLKFNSAQKSSPSNIKFRTTGSRYGYFNQCVADFHDSIIDLEDKEFEEYLKVLRKK